MPPQCFLNHLAFDRFASVPESPTERHSVTACELQIFRHEVIAIAHNHGPLDAILQLTNIPWPTVLKQSALGQSTELRNALFQLGGKLTGEGLGQKGDILLTFAQRR